MGIVQRLSKVWQQPFFNKYSTIFYLWIISSIVAALLKYGRGAYNNYLIFKGVFWNTINQLPLYTLHPSDYNDVNLYGPVFSLVIAPFAVLPDWLGITAWNIALTSFLYLAIRKLPISTKQHIFIYWFCLLTLLTALFMQQFNIAVAATLILAFTFIEKENDIWAAFFIILGTSVKLYSIAGLAFFFFSKHKLKFLAYCVLWSIILFVAPMLISSPEFVISQYIDWYNALAFKNTKNLFSVYQNISLLGMMRKISGSASYSDLYPIIAGLILFALPYLRIKQYKNLPFRLTLLASVLLFIVLFSTGSESSSYITPLIGITIWYLVAPWKRSKLDIFLLIFAFIIVGFSSSDLIPKIIKVSYIRPYALKALPCSLIWLKIIYEMCTKSYISKENKKESSIQSVVEI